MPNLKNVLNWKFLPYAVALLFTLGILAIHMLPNMDSMLNENNSRISHGFLKSQIDYHQEIAPFARRPLTSILIESAIDVFGIRHGHAFILINFILLFISGTLLFRLSEQCKATTGQALANLCIYYLSFSVLFAFFPPVFSYDEPLQYCFILLSLTAFVRKNWLWFVLFFTMALIARETSMLLLPALTFFMSGIHSYETKTYFKIQARLYIPILLPLLCYGIYLSIFIYTNDQLQATQVEMASRYSCFLENFESTRNTVETWTSLFLALAPFLYFVVIKMQQRTITRPQKSWIGAFLLTVAINTPIVILTAFARETRLFALPLFFIWPVFVQLFGQEIKLLFSFKLYPKVFQNWPYPIALLVLNLINYWFCFQYYAKLGLGENTFFGEYLFISIFVISLHFLLYRFLKTHPSAYHITQRKR